MAQRKSLVAFLAVLLAAPVGAATWFTSGTYEPDTKCDNPSGCTNPATGQSISGGWMYQTPPDSPGAEKRVYLNGYAVAVQGSGVNPNSGITGSRIMANSLTFYAYFGVWKDCNRDGYIGALQGALHTYRRDLGIDSAVCPDGSEFHRGGWVYEFQWIGAGSMIAGENGGDYPSADDIRYINDSSARVWSDWDLPGHVSPGGSSCPTAPSYGTTASTGALIAHVDCITTRNIARNVNAASDATGLGVGFGPHTSDPYRSDSPLNQDLPFNLWGNPYAGEGNDEWQTGILEYNSRKDRQPGYDDNLDYDPDRDHRAFDVWDCSDPDGTTSEANGVPALDPTVSDDPLHASWYDGLNATERGTYGLQHFVLSDTTGVSSNGLLGTGHTTCSREETSNVWWIYTPGVEGGEPGNDDVGPGRSAVETTFVFSLGGQPARGCQTKVSRPLDEGDLVACTDGTDPSGALLNTTLGEGYQYGADFRGPVALRPSWTGTPPWLTTSPINRRDLEPQSGRYVTIYGTYGAATTATGATTAKGAPALYANEWCEGQFAGDTRADGFNCDAGAWYAQGEPQANGMPIGIRPGQPYQARDIDCYDGEVARGSGVYASLAQFGDTGVCADATT